VDAFSEEAYLDYIARDPYLNFVVLEAKKLGKRFMLDSGEGGEYIDPKTGWLIEELSGWLINPSDQERFMLLYQHKNKNEEIYTEFSEEYRFVKWTITEEDSLKVSFVNYGTHPIE